MARLSSPYESSSQERRAIVDALELAAWMRYTTPAWQVPRDALQRFEELAARRLVELGNKL